MGKKKRRKKDNIGLMTKEVFVMILNEMGLKNDDRAIKQYIDLELVSIVEESGKSHYKVDEKKFDAFIDEQIEISKNPDFNWVPEDDILQEKCHGNIEEYQEFLKLVDMGIFEKKIDHGKLYYRPIENYEEIVNKIPE